MKKAEQRRQEVLDLIVSNPKIPYSDIGMRVGITRERVRQILKQNNLHESRSGLIVTKTCPVCNKVKTELKSKIFGKTCSVECARKNLSKRTTLTCECGTVFTRRPSEIRSKICYCSRECFQKYRGK